MSQLVHDFVEFYSDFKFANFSQLADLYAEEVVFIDPVHQVNGLPALTRYFEGVMKGVAECRFDCYRIATSADPGGISTSTIEWHMHFRHPRLSSGLITVDGVSVLDHDQKIFRHRDYYDMGAIVYEYVPLMGRVVRRIKSKLATS